MIVAGGKLISATMEECRGVSIKFPTAESDIRGPKDDVERAKVHEMSNEKQLSSFALTPNIIVSSSARKALPSRKSKTPLVHASTAH